MILSLSWFYGTKEKADLLLYPHSMSADYLKLFLAKRLTAKEPHQLEHIKSRLAAMQIEDPIRYKEYSEFYGVSVDVEVTKEPSMSDKPITKTVTTEVKMKKKAGRPAKV